MGPGEPFASDIDENEIEQATLIDQLLPALPANLNHTSGSETWACAWSPDGSYFAWSCGNRMVKLVPWNQYKNTTLATNNLDDKCNVLPERSIVNLDCGGHVWSLAFGSSTAEKKLNSRAKNLNWFRYHNASDLVLATGLDNGRIRVWNVTKGSLMLDLLDHNKVVRDLAFAPDGSMRLASVARDGKLKLWDMQDDGNMYKTLSNVSKWFYSVAWSPDAKMIACTGDCKSVIIWDADTFQLLHKLTGHHHDVCSCAFTPDGAVLLTASFDTRVIMWDPHTGDTLSEFRHQYPMPSPIFAGGANGSYVREVSVCHDGIHISTICDDSYLRFWDITRPHAPVQIGTVQQATSCAFSPDGRVLAVGNKMGVVTFWRSPDQVHNLQHLCRMAFRRHWSSSQLESLELPKRILQYLMYRE